ncbi:DUF4124 domain-containing protein [Corallococcus caeni]|uniref:DUF4124 domain-containing protein n=1 Tax=Corallococcus caeni TaxID=3082388 RepID=UPI0033657D0A
MGVQVPLGALPFPAPSRLEDETPASPYGNAGVVHFSERRRLRPPGSSRRRPWTTARGSAAPSPPPAR